jgi:signal transduction histidine kinase
MPLQPGDEVEVAGFPVPGLRTAVLEDAEVRIASRGAPPAPIEANLEAVREGLHDSELVCVEATLVNSVRTAREWRLLLQSRDTVFDARLAVGASAPWKTPADGSRVRLTGIALSHDEAGEVAGSFSLLLRSTADVTLVSHPPWWTGPRTRLIVGLLSIAILVAAAWAIVLRRQVRRQTALIREQMAREQDLDGRYRDDLEALVWQRTRELEEAQAELVKRERLSTLGRLTATVSHELRNPLGTIRGSLFVIGNAVRGRSLGVERALERAERNVLRCDTIIEELLEYTRVRDLLPQSTPLDPWLDDLLDEISIPAGLVLDRSLSSGAIVRIDRGRIQRCIVNLVSNACEALTASASHSAERLWVAAHDRLWVASRLESRRVVVSVSDNGPGISPDDRRRIFEPFFSTKSFGIGLGLAIVQQIAEQHGGGIDLESDPGPRTTFTLWLPLALVEGRIAPSAASGEAP